MWGCGWSRGTGCGWQGRRAVVCCVHVCMVRWWGLQVFSLLNLSGTVAVPAYPLAAAESSGLPAGQRGTYAGVAAKVEHLKQLGINAGEEGEEMSGRLVCSCVA